MRYGITMSIVMASMLALMAAPSDAGQGRGGSGGAGSAAAEQVDREQADDQDRIQDRGRLEARDRDQDRAKSRDTDMDQDRQRLHLRDSADIRDQDIYGSELMTAEELQRYRKQLQEASTAKAREQFQLQHEARMLERAMEQNRDLVPPGQGPIFAGEQMSVQERNAYREQLRALASEEERLRFQAEHREKMQLKAKAKAKAQEHEVEEAE